MPNQTWEEIVAGAQLSAEERKLLDNLQEKLPELREGGLRQSDYSRKMAALKAQETAVAEAIEYNTRMKAWADSNVPKWERLVEQGVVGEDGEDLWLTKQQKLEQDLEAAKKAAIGGDMDPAELDKRVREIVKDSGLALNKEQLANLYADEGRKMTEKIVDDKYKQFETNFNEKTIPFTTGFATSMAVMAGKYERTTGKEWTDEDQKAVFDLMAKEQNFNPRVIVDKYMEPTIQAKKTEEEIERRAQEKAEKIAGERRGMPGSGNEPYVPTVGESRGSLQRMMEESKGDEDVESQVYAAAKVAAKELAMGK